MRRILFYDFQIKQAEAEDSMSSAFSKEPDGNEIVEDFGDRPVSPHRNLVTPEGLAFIDSEIERLRVDMAKAEAAQDRAGIAHASRDLRYWSARRANAELITEIVDHHEVRFGHKVSLTWDDGRKQTYRIVGEDEADPSKGTIAYVAPLAAAMLGKSLGDEVSIGHGTAEITAIA